MILALIFFAVNSHAQFNPFLHRRPVEVISFQVPGTGYTVGVPYYATKIYIQAWGAGGGGGGGSANAGGTIGAPGGSGGYASGYFQIPPGTADIVIDVGAGGAGGIWTGAAPGGASGGRGGGFSRVAADLTPLLIAGAGGGGGGGALSTNAVMPGAGGAGGYLDGSAGGSSSPAIGGGPGLLAGQTGGIGGGTTGCPQSGTYIVATSGIALNGGRGGLCSRGVQSPSSGGLPGGGQVYTTDQVQGPTGGGGGGGWAGGGGGGANTSFGAGGAGGGGGSGYTDPIYLIGLGVNAAGTGTVPPAQTEKGYLTGRGTGGAAGSAGASGGAGGNGLVLIYFLY